MVLQDARNVYGAVLEGSYIFVDGTCLTRKELLELSKYQQKDRYVCPHGRMDQEVDDLRGCFDHFKYDQNPISLNQDDLDAKVLEIDEWHAHKRWDFCVFLKAWAQGGGRGRLDMLMLEWVDKQARVARRVGYLPFEFLFEESSCFDMVLHKMPWIRWRLKLV